MTMDYMPDFVTQNLLCIILIVVLAYYYGIEPTEWSYVLCMTIYCNAILLVLPKHPFVDGTIELGYLNGFPKNCCYYTYQVNIEYDCYPVETFCYRYVWGTLIHYYRHTDSCHSLLYRIILNREGVEIAQRQYERQQHNANKQYAVEMEE